MKPIAIAIVLFLLVLTFYVSDQLTHAQLTQDEIDLNSFLIMPETLLYKIMKGEDDYVLVDVRPEEDFRVSHVAGAVNLPWDDGTFVKRRSELPRGKSVIFISESGLKALKALRVLLQDEYEERHDSFREMFSIEGGMNNWPYREYLQND